MLEKAARCLDGAQNAKVRCDFEVVQACEALQELLTALWGAGPRAEAQVQAALGVVCRLRRLATQGLERMKDGRFPGPDGGMYPSPLFSMKENPTAAK